VTGLEHAVTTKNAKGTKSPGIFTYKLRGFRTTMPEFSQFAQISGDLTTEALRAQRESLK
jgi:hypothetical protein